MRRNYRGLKAAVICPHSKWALAQLHEPLFLGCENYLAFNKSLISVNNFTSAGASAGLASSFFFNEFIPFTKRNIINASITKLISTVKKFPHAKTGPNSFAFANGKLGSA